MNIMSRIRILFATATLLAMPARADINTGQQLNLPFSGNFLDASAAVRTVAPNGNAALGADRDGRPSQACVFDGAGDYLAVSPNLAGTTDFTVSFWVYIAQPLPVGAYYCLVQSANAQVLWDHWVDPDRGPGHSLDVAVFPSRNGTSSAYWHTIPADDFTNRWTHIAVAVTGGTTVVYIDGQQRSYNGPRYDGGMTGQYGQTRIGAVHNGLNGQMYSFLNGSMDDVRCYDRALGAQEIVGLTQGFLWSYQAGAAIERAPALDAAGNLYVGADDSKLVPRQFSWVKGWG